MKSLVYYGPQDLRLEERPIPSPKKGEVLVKIHAVSVCGSDLGSSVKIQKNLLFSLLTKLTIVGQ